MVCILLTIGHKKETRNKRISKPQSKSIAKHKSTRMRMAIFRFWEIEAYNKLGKLKAHIVCPDMINFHKF